MKNLFNGNFMNLNLWELTQKCISLLVPVENPTNHAGFHVGRCGIDFISQSM